MIPQVWLENRSLGLRQHDTAHTPHLMLAGHIGVALTTKRIEPGLNLGFVLLASLLPDILLWVLVLAGAELIREPHPSGAARFYTFTFPYSHSLLANVGWTLTVGLVAAWAWPSLRPGRLRAAGLLALVTFSHFLLDLIVHVPDLPVAGSHSPMWGLGLWRNMPMALLLELSLAVGGFWLLTQHHPPRRLWIVSGTITIVTSLLTILGPYATGEPPSARTVASSSLILLLVIVILGFIADGKGATTKPALHG